MKKLMTMLAAVGMAFGLFAADAKFISGAGFDTSDTANPTDTSYYTWLYNTETSTGDFVTGFWTGTDKASIVVDTYTCAGGHPLQFDDKSHNRDQYLKIESGTDLVSQRILPGSAKKSIGDDGLYFDGLVQFTSFEDDVPAIDDDAKIAVFPMVDDPEADTPVSHLIIKAFGTETNLWTTTETITDDAWRRVTIKMIKNIKKSGDPQVGFVVFLDGSETPVRFDTTKVEGGKSAFDNADLTPEAVYFNTMGALFGALTGTAEMTDVAFGGKGAIDEIAFTENAPTFAASPKFAWIKGAEHIASFDYSTENWKADDDALVVQLEIGKTTGTAAVSNIKAEDGYFVTTTAYDVDVTAGETNTVGEATALGATVEIEGQAPKYYETAAEALTKFLNTVETPTEAKLTLNAETSDAITIDNANLELTLDLNGKTITQGDAEAAINVNAGALTIVDNAGGGIVSQNDEKGDGAAAVTAWSGTLTIVAGQYDGLVAGTEVGIVGGKFLASANEKEALQVFVTDPDAELVEKDGYYILQTVTDFTVEVPEAEDNTTLAVTIDDVAAGDTNGVYTVAKGSTLKAVYTADEGYELDEGEQGEWTVDYETKDTVVIDAPTAHQIMVDFTVAEVTGAELLAVSNGTEEVIADQGKYTVPTNATVTLYYAPAAGYKLTKTTAEVTIDTADQKVDVSGEIAPAQIEYVAQINEDPNKKFETLAEAFAAVENDETIKLLAAVTEGVLYEDAKKFTIDLNGQTWTWNGGQEGNWAALKVFGGAADITIVDNAEGGKMYAAGDGFCIWAKSGKVTINSGKFYNNSNDDYAIYVNGTAQVVINDGEFRNEKDAPYIWKGDLAKLNLNVENNNPNATITVYGGTYSAEPKDDSGVKFVAEGKKAVENEGIWTVKDIEYATLTIATVENLTISVTNAEGVAQTTGAKFDKDLATELYVTRTPDSGYELDGYAATETITMSVDVTVTGAVKSASQPVNPGEEKKYEKPEEAQAAAKAINDNKEAMIKVPAEAEATKTAYLERVAAKVLADGVTVVVDIAEGQEATFKGELDAQMEDAVVAAALTDASATTATITTVAGFYYWIEGGVEVGTINQNGTPKIGTGSTVTLDKPALGTTTKAFYKLAVGVKDPAITCADD